MKNRPIRLSDEQILQAVRDVELEEFGRVEIKIRHGSACFIEKQITEQVKPEGEIPLQSRK